MKKAIIFSLILISSRYFSQSAAFEKNTHVITAGYGGPNLFRSILKSGAEDDQSYFDGSKTISYKITSVGRAFLKYDYSVNGCLGLGVPLVIMP